MKQLTKDEAMDLLRRILARMERIDNDLTGIDPQLFIGGDVFTNIVNKQRSAIAQLASFFGAEKGASGKWDSGSDRCN